MLFLSCWHFTIFKTHWMIKFKNAFISFRCFPSFEKWNVWKNDNRKKTTSLFVWCLMFNIFVFAKFQRSPSTYRQILSSLRWHTRNDYELWNSLHKCFSTCVFLHVFFYMSVRVFNDSIQFFDWFRLINSLSLLLLLSFFFRSLHSSVELPLGYMHFSCLKHWNIAKF